MKIDVVCQQPEMSFHTILREILLVISDICRISNTLIVWEVSLSFAPETPYGNQFWFRHNGHVPKPGQCLYMSLVSPEQRFAMVGALACAPSGDKLPTYETKPDWAG